MGRIKPAYYYERQLAITNARDTYLRNNPPPVNPGPIASRGATVDRFYRSMTLLSGAAPIIFGVKVPVATETLVTAAQLGLMTVLGAGEVALRLRGSGVKPSKICWYAGDTTPTRESSPWGSKWNKYYADKHYSAPFSRASGTVTATELRQAFEALFGTGGSKRGLLGPANGRAWLELESAPGSFSN